MERYNSLTINYLQPPTNKRGGVLYKFAVATQGVALRCPKPFPQLLQPVVEAAFFVLAQKNNVKTQ
jgi:hypothetical protein